MQLRRLRGSSIAGANHLHSMGGHLAVTGFHPLSGEGEDIFVSGPHRAVRGRPVTPRRGFIATIIALALLTQAPTEKGQRLLWPIFYSASAVDLPPGQAYQLSVPLDSIFQFSSLGTYSVTVSHQVGMPGKVLEGPWVASGTLTFTIARAHPHALRSPRDAAP